MRNLMIKWSNHKTNLNRKKYDSSRNDSSYLCGFKRDVKTWLLTAKQTWSLSRTPEKKKTTTSVLAFSWAQTGNSEQLLPPFVFHPSLLVPVHQKFKSVVHWSQSHSILIPIPHSLHLLVSLSSFFLVSFLPSFLFLRKEIIPQEKLSREDKFKKCLHQERGNLYFCYFAMFQRCYNIFTIR